MNAQVKKLLRGKKACDPASGVSPLVEKEKWNHDQGCCEAW